LTWMEPAEWNERARKEDPLYLNVVRKHLLLYGAELVME